MLADLFWGESDEARAQKELYLQALKELSAHYTEQRDYAQAIPWARQLISASPLQEEMHRALMQLYALTGNRTAALQQYVECEAVLQKELNAKPLLETRVLNDSALGTVPIEKIGLRVLNDGAGPFVCLYSPNSEFLFTCLSSSNRSSRQPGRHIRPQRSRAG